MATVIDCLRAQTVRTGIRQRLDSISLATPEQIMIDETEKSELWRLVSCVVATRQERTILYECFVLDLPPRVILSRHPDLFATITAVYSTKRNLLERLRRSPELRQFECQR